LVVGIVNLLSLFIALADASYEERNAAINEEEAQAKARKANERKQKAKAAAEAKRRAEQGSLTGCYLIVRARTKKQ
jgi:hypothetical protein